MESAFPTATSIGTTTLTGAISGVTGWAPLTATSAIQVGLASLSLIVGYYYTIKTVRIGDLSVSAPFRYTTMLGAVALGWTVFAEVPNLLTISGCVVILASGLVAIQLERGAPGLIETAIG